MAGALPTTNCQTEPTMINVCEKSSGKVVSIDEATYDDTKYSKDTSNCQPPTIEVCELATGKVVTIDEEDYDSTKYSKDTENCTASSSSGTGSGGGTTLPITPTR